MTLIERLEALEAPCRECDVLIDPVNGTAFHYTAYIDAAITLLPEGAGWLRKDFHTMTVVIDAPNEKMWSKHIDGGHKSPAIALSIAALKAQETANAQ